MRTGLNKKIFKVTKKLKNPKTQLDDSGETLSNRMHQIEERLSGLEDKIEELNL